MKTKIILSLALLAILIPSFCFSAELRWGRVKFEVKEQDTEDKWDINFYLDTYFLEEVNKLTTLKVNTKVDTVPLDDLSKLTNYSILFMTASGTPVLTEKEIKNLKEYLLRGGFLFAEDCIDFRTELVMDKFYRGFRKIVEERLFPGKKMEALPPEHPVYHSHFDLPKGLVCDGAVVEPGLGLHDDKNRLMILLSAADLHCEWSTRDAKKTPFAYKMGINMLMYVLTH